MPEKTGPIVVVGSINMDLVSRVPRIPHAGETIFGTDFQTHAGGKGANQAVGVARLGYPVALIGVLGQDAFGKELRSQLTKEGVDTTHVGEADGPTGTASILVEAGGENCIVVTPGANLHLTPEILQAKRDVLSTAGVVLTQLEIPIAAIECLSEMCVGLGVPLILDPAPAQPLSTKVWRGVTWITPNETEAHFYAPGSATADETLAALLQTGAKGVILKCGANGSVLGGRDRVTQRVAAMPVKTVDTTAAGDAFNAGFAVGLMEGFALLDCARFATAAAAVSVTRVGAQTSLATRDEAFAALGEHLESSLSQ